MDQTHYLNVDQDVKDPFWSSVSARACKFTKVHLIALKPSLRNQYEINRVSVYLQLIAALTATPRLQYPPPQHYVKLRRNRILDILGNSSILTPWPPRHSLLRNLRSLCLTLIDVWNIRVPISPLYRYAICSVSLTHKTAPKLPDRIQQAPIPIYHVFRTKFLNNLCIYIVKCSYYIASSKIKAFVLQNDTVICSERKHKSMLILYRNSY